MRSVFTLNCRVLGGGNPRRGANKIAWYPALLLSYFLSWYLGWAPFSLCAFIYETICLTSQRTCVALRRSGKYEATCCTTCLCAQYLHVTLWRWFCRFRDYKAHARLHAVRMKLLDKRHRPKEHLLYSFLKTVQRSKSWHNFYRTATVSDAVCNPNIVTSGPVK
jgi:hypothetical protein